MKAQINLLPDIKLVYIRSRRIKYIVCTISLFIIAATGAILLILWHHAFRNQPDTIKGYQQTINDYVIDFNGAQNENISKYITIQNQLEVLDDLGQDKTKPFLMEQFLGQFLPAEYRNGATAIINNYEIDFTNLIEHDGTEYGQFSVGAQVRGGIKEDEALVYHFANAYYEQQFLDPKTKQSFWRCVGPSNNLDDRENLAHCPIFPKIEWSSPFTADGTSWRTVTISGAINQNIFAKGKPPVRAKLRPGCASGSCLGVPITEVQVTQPSPGSQQNDQP